MTLTRRDLAHLEPRTAPAIGVRTPEQWPYGPNICGESRVALRDWATRHGLRIDQRAWCEHWITTRNRCLSHSGTRALWVDHITGWKVGRDRAVLVSQPYGTVDPDEVRAFAAPHGLEVHVDPDGGWYGAGTTFVAVYDPKVIETVTT